MHWCEKYIGIPYEECNCAQLVSLVLDKEFNCFDASRQLLGYTPKGRRAQSDTILNNWPELAEKIDIPYDGCGIILKLSGRLAHMGICAVTDSGIKVLHATTRDGAVLESIDSKKLSIEGFYKWK